MSEVQKQNTITKEQENELEQATSQREKLKNEIKEIEEKIVMIQGNIKAFMNRILYTYDPEKRYLCNSEYRKFNIPKTLEQLRKELNDKKKEKRLFDEKLASHTPGTNNKNDQQKRALSIDPTKDPTPPCIEEILASLKKLTKAPDKEDTEIHKNAEIPPKVTEKKNDINKQQKSVLEESSVNDNQDNLERISEKNYAAFDIIPIGDFSFNILQEDGKKHLLKDHARSIDPFDEKIGYYKVKYGGTVNFVDKKGKFFLKHGMDDVNGTFADAKDYKLRFESGNINKMKWWGKHAGKMLGEALSFVKGAPGKMEEGNASWWNIRKKIEERKIRKKQQKEIAEKNRARKSKDYSGTRGGGDKNTRDKERHI